MEEADYVVGLKYKEPHGNRAPNHLIAKVVEDYVNNPNLPLYKIGLPYGLAATLVSDYINLVLFNRPQNPVVIIRQSAV